MNCNSFGCYPAEQPPARGAAPAAGARGAAAAGAAGGRRAVAARARAARALSGAGVKSTARIGAASATSSAAVGAEAPNRSTTSSVTRRRGRGREGVPPRACRRRDVGDGDARREGLLSLAALGGSRARDRARGPARRRGRGRRGRAAEARAAGRRRASAQATAAAQARARATMCVARAASRDARADRDTRERATRAPSLGAARARALCREEIVLRRVRAPPPYRLPASALPLPPASRLGTRHSGALCDQQRQLFGAPRTSSCGTSSATRPACAPTPLGGERDHVRGIPAFVIRPRRRRAGHAADGARRLRAARAARGRARPQAGGRAGRARRRRARHVGAPAVSARTRPRAAASF